MSLRSLRMSAKKEKRKLTQIVMSSEASEMNSVMEVNEEDWGDTRTAGQCLTHICMSEHLSDISFTFTKKQNVTLTAHKFVLSMRSTVFEAMFYGPLAEGGNTVLIEDIEPEIMEVLLRFMYSDKPELNGDNVLRSLYAANKYALAGLVKECSAYLENDIDADSVCSIHEQSVFYDMKPLQTKCFNFILENASGVFASRGFLEVSHATLLNLLKSDKLSEDEINIFQACIKWANHDCQTNSWKPTTENIRKSLGEAVYQVRFPTMPMDVFAKVISPTGILSSEEQVILYQYIATKGSTSLSKFAHSERYGSAKTVDLSKYTTSQTRGHQYGYCLTVQVKNQANNIKTSLTVRSVTGTFVQNIHRITASNTKQNITYRIHGNKITFEEPIHVVNNTIIHFHEKNPNAISHSARAEVNVYGNIFQSGQAESVDNPDVMSCKVREQVEVNGSKVVISLIPMGLTSISFAR